MKMGKMSLKGYTSFVKKHMDLRGLGVVVLGLGLPSVAGYLTSTNVGARVMSYVDMVPGMTTNVGKAVSAVALTAGVSYLAASFGAISASEALTANMIALGLVTVGVLQSMNLPMGNNFVSALPSAGGLAGLGSYGYIGSYHMSGGHDHGMGVGADMLEAPKTDQLFGVRANVF
tara:strand:- start:218 stop:739 length:522 start_codon:yes stop_codon:yes gene_type:complete